MTEFTPIDISNLEVFRNPCDPRRDLPLFVDYVQEREVKRLYRTNDLSKADALRLAKMMSDPEAEAEVREHGGAGWVDFVDWLALKLGFVSYDTQGSYAGYSSAEPTFPDNYILFNPGKYQKFAGASLADQERFLLNTLLSERDGCRSEFFMTSVLGRLDGFSSWGCATGVVPHLDFPKIRRFLLDLLGSCQMGVWYSTASLIQHLKTNYPFFLIPQKPRYKDTWGRRQRRYLNFHESRDQWGQEIDIFETEADAFERVEGRYVERFLEGIPLVLGYVEVAYSQRAQREIYPAINLLQAFRVNSRLPRAIRGDIPQPRVTVQPNFEIYVESEFYPANVLAQLLPLTEMVSEDVLTILKLQKERVAAQVAQDDRLDVLKLLTELSGQELPRNVARELSEWAAHSEKFTLYQGFALLEGDERLPPADPFTVERISPTLRIVHSPDVLFVRLEEAELIPLRVRHDETALRPLPDKARTIFVKKSQVTKPKPEKQEEVILKRQTTIILHFPDRKVLNTFRKALLDARCPVEVDQHNLTIAFARQVEPQVARVIKSLESKYLIRIEDIS
jgi:hypothetical protein